MKLYYGSYKLNDSCGSSHVRTDAQTKMKSDLSMLLHHALHWAVYEKSQFMRLWYLSYMQPAKAQTSLHIRSLARGGGRGPTARKQSGQCFFSQQLILQFIEWIQWFYYREEEGVQLLPGGGGVQRNPYNL